LRQGRYQGARPHRTACKPIKEVSLGTTQQLIAIQSLDLEALQQLAASRDADGKDVVEIQSDIVKFRSPLPVEQSANLQGSARTPRAKTPEIGGTESYCTGEDYPGEIGDKQACLTASECDGLCTNGDDGLIGTACTTDAQCNTAGTSDGLCSSASICQTYAIMTIAGNNIFFDGFNVHVRSGAGATWGTAELSDHSYPEQGTVNGLGNLIIGYDEDRVLLDPSQPNEKTGSHNLVIGPFHTYDRIGGFVTGLGNSIRGHYASVSGGMRQTASGHFASVSGGVGNQASGMYASVSGGRENRATAAYDFGTPGGFEPAAWVGGGEGNVASGYQSSISGGWENTSSARHASVSGGAYNEASGERASVSGGYSNTADADLSAVSGGAHNTASGTGALVSGGYRNTADGDYAVASGGEDNESSSFASVASGGYANRATASHASVSGGQDNEAAATSASISGGLENQATGDFASVSGGRANTASGTYEHLP